MARGSGRIRRTSSEQKSLFVYLFFIFFGHKLFSNTEVSWSKMTHLQFREQLVCDLVRAAEDMAVKGKGIQRGKPSPTSSHLSRLKIKHTKH
jgi:hypothetical protein